MHQTLSLLLIFSSWMLLAHEPTPPIKLSGKLKLLAPETASEKPKVTEANFTVFWFTNGWRYGLEFTTHQTGSRVQAIEVACDGQDLYELLTLTPEAHQKNLESDRAKMAAATSGQEAIVSSGVIPRNIDPIHIFPWLAFCNKSNFNGLRNQEMMPNIFPRSSWPTNRVHFQASFGEPPGLFPATLQIFKPGVIQIKTPGDAAKITLKKYPPPYDSGFVGANYQVKSWTNLDNIKVPKESQLTYHDLQEVDGRWQQTTNLTVISVVEKSEFAPNAEVLPTPRIDTQVIDLRFPAKGWISYFTTTNSPKLQTQPIVLEKFSRTGHRVTINGK